MPTSPLLRVTARRVVTTLVGALIGAGFGTVSGTVDVRHVHVGPFNGGTTITVHLFGYGLYKLMGVGDDNEAAEPYVTEYSDASAKVLFAVAGALIGAALPAIGRPWKGVGYVFGRALLGLLAGAIIMPVVFLPAPVDPWAMPYVGACFGAMLGVVLGAAFAGFATVAGSRRPQ